MNILSTTGTSHLTLAGVLGLYLSFDQLQPSHLLMEITPRVMILIVVVNLINNQFFQKAEPGWESLLSTY